MKNLAPETAEVILGNVDPVSGNIISGWAYLRDHPNTPLTVFYAAPDGAIIEAIADLPRPELNLEEFGGGCCGFELILPEPVSPKAGAIEIRVEGHDAVLRGVVDRMAPSDGRFFIRDPECSSEAIGVIDSTEDGVIEGWLFSPDPAAVPVIRVAGRFAEPIEFRKPRPDVNDVLGVTGNMGFVFTLTGLCDTDLVELHVLTSRGLALVNKRQSGRAKLEENFFAQLNKVLTVAQDERAVAVVCWDGAHNPIGRAKVLLDVASSRRPAVLITYIFEEFGERVWSPLQSLDIPVLSIPWKHRAMYHRALELAGLKFNTVWLCKARLPTFLLAKAVAAPDARLVLDYDDNEEHFSSSAGSRDKAYGVSSINLALALARNIPARTAASITLQDKYGAQSVRHARERHERRSVEQGAFRIAFIGTARAHKNALDAARAIRLFALTTGIPVEYHVYGDVQPDTLVEELEGNGAIVRQTVPMSELHETLAGMDVVLTGYPSTSDRSITDYQISSKIGDALAVGKPVLVPESASTSDLRDVPGVFLFDEGSFIQRLQSALAWQDELALPAEFTLEGAYQGFAIAEKEAEAAPRAREALALLPPSVSVRANGSNVLLVWKQPDAGLYGRRVDQIARAYKRAHPHSNVVILELVHQTTLEHYQSNSRNRLSDQGLLLELSSQKQSVGLDDDGVMVRQIVYSSSAKLAGLFDKFLLQEGMLPCNTAMVAFPLITFFEKILPTMTSFPLIVDVVDNQFSWPGQDPVQTKLFQYTSLCRSAYAVIFNSDENHRYFKSSGIISQDSTSRTIPNWYSPPLSVSEAKLLRLPGFNILYSGNMNDRIDWMLIRKIAEFRAEVTLHLVGSANITNPHFAHLLSMSNVVCHGPLNERQTFSLLKMVDVAVMPHEVDEISVYMNPLKVHMYAAAGVPAVATSVPGIEPSKWLHVASDHDHFLRLLGQLASSKVTKSATPEEAASVQAYVKLIDSLRDPRFCSSLKLTDRRPLSVAA
jgi:glycosyltransferase involved in cell wall biosynthesis